MARFRKGRRFFLIAVACTLCIGGIGAAAPWRFSGERALSHIVRQVDMGPRIAGSAGHERTRHYLLSTLRRLADRIETQDFFYVDPAGRFTLPGTNIVASFRPETSPRIMLAAHWDSRPRADRELLPERRALAVPGANDGASGVAVLLELARLLRAKPPAVGVDIVLFDLEDMGGTDGTPYLIGSRHFVRSHPAYRPVCGVLLDMVCDRQLRLPQELYSRQQAPECLDRVWAFAQRADAYAFLPVPGEAVKDDHLPFLEAGLPVIDLVHTPFPWYWHTAADTPDRCSAENLRQVGEVLTEMVYNERPWTTSPEP